MPEACPGFFWFVYVSRVQEPASGEESGADDDEDDEDEPKR